MPVRQLLKELGEMSTRLYRSIHEPIREGLSWDETWRGPDNSLIYCWEHGRQERVQRPDDAARAEAGELIGLDWKGGVRKKLKVEKAQGTLRYLATWQGIRGEDLDIELEGERLVVCSRTGQAVVFSAKLPKEDEEEA
jgi:hypothetical protein